jgi:hypothetical protein
MVVDGKLADCATAPEEDKAWEAAFVRSDGPKAVKDLAQQFGDGVAADAPVLVETAPTLFRTLGTLLRRSDGNLPPPELDRLANAAVRIALLPFENMTSEKASRQVLAIEYALDTLQQLLSRCPSSLAALGAEWLQSLATSVLPAITHPTPAVRRSLGKVLEEVAERNRVVVGPLLEKLPDLVEKEARLDPSRASSSKQRADSRDLGSSTSLLASLLNVAGPDNPTAKQVVLKFANAIGTDLPQTQTGAAVLNSLLNRGNASGAWVSLFVPLLPRQWVAKCICASLGCQSADVRPLGSRSYRPHPSIVQPVEKLVIACLRPPDPEVGLKVVANVAEELNAFLGRGVRT